MAEKLNMILSSYPPDETKGVGQNAPAQTFESLALLPYLRSHFLFNTLATIQHWVDVGDPRGGPLLRSLTAVLRGVSHVDHRGTNSLGVEFATVKYLCCHCGGASW